MPFVATSYLLGLSAISLRDYMLGILAALPALLGYVSPRRVRSGRRVSLDGRRRAISMGIAGAASLTRTE